MNSGTGHDPSDRQGGPGDGSSSQSDVNTAGSGDARAPQPGRPVIQVLPAGSSVPPAQTEPSAYDARAEGLGAAAPGAPQAVPPRTAPRAAPPSGRRGGGRVFSLSTALLALLAIVVIGAVWYTSSSQRRDGASDRTDEAAASETVETSAAPADYDEASPAAEEDASPASEAALDGQAAPAAPEDRLPGAEPGQVAAADPSEPPQPEPETARGEASASGTVRAFYSALSAGDGASAAQLVIPSKRQSGPLSAGALSNYYSSFRRPLRVRRVSEINANAVRVAYDYVLADGRLCEGQAVVNVVQSGDRRLVSGIRAQGPC